MDTALPFFDRLLRAAAVQPEPQRLLLLFAQAELPDDATPEQRARYEAGAGGAVVPLACVDRDPGELTTFEALVAESREACPPWQVLLVAALAGTGGKPPAPPTVDAALEAMVDNVRAGRLGGYMALDPAGNPLQFTEGPAA